MISSIVDLVLLAALAGTSGAVLMMYRRLQRFDALQGQAAKEFARSSEALDRAREAMMKLQDDGGEMAVTLAGRLNEARLVINDIDEATARTQTAFASHRERASVETVAETLAGTAIEVPEAIDRSATAALESVDATADGVDESAERAPVVPAAIRIRDAARARINAAREKSAGAQPAPVPGPRTPRPPVPSSPPRLPETIMPRIHKAPGEGAAMRSAPSGAAALAASRPQPTGPVMMLVKPDAARASAWSPTMPDDTNGPVPGLAEAVIAARQVTWNDLARAAQHTH